MKASIRYNSLGEFNQSPDNRRKGMTPKNMRENIFRTSEIFKGRTKLFSKDYREIVFSANKDDLIYMDPPYQGVCSNRDQRYIKGIVFEEFVETLKELNDRSMSFIVSYDGRTGSKVYGERLPDRLGLIHKEINAGKSSQATLLGRDAVTYESVYISKALSKRIGGIDHVIEEQLELVESY